MELCAMEHGPCGDVRFFYLLTYLAVFLLLAYLSCWPRHAQSC